MACLIDCNHLSKQQQTYRIAVFSDLAQAGNTRAGASFQGATQPISGNFSVQIMVVGQTTLRKTVFHSTERNRAWLPDEACSPCHF
jgi:hypothetical protein